MAEKTEPQPQSISFEQFTEAVTTSVLRAIQAHVATTSGPTDGSECKLYRAGVYPHRQVAETAQGGGDSFDFAARLRPGDTLIAVWSGGVAGDAATLNLTGVLHAMAA